MDSSAAAAAAAAAGEPPPPPSTTADSLLWARVCEEVFERMMYLRARRKAGSNRAVVDAERRKALFPPELREAVQTRGESLYPYMRLLVPGKDVQDRGRYSMKSTRLAEAYIDRLGLGGTPDAAALKAFKATSGGGGDAENDFAHAVFELLKQKQGRKPPSTWTVAHINIWLDELVRIGSAPKVTGKDQFPHFATVVATLSPLEHKWLVRMIMVRGAAHAAHLSRGSTARARVRRRDCSPRAPAHAAAPAVPPRATTPPPPLPPSPATLCVRRTSSTSPCPRTASSTCTTPTPRTSSR